MKTVILYTEDEFSAKWPTVYSNGPRNGDLWPVYRDRIPCGNFVSDGAGWVIASISVFAYGGGIDELKRLQASLAAIERFILSDGTDRPLSQDSALTVTS